MDSSRDWHHLPSNPYNPHAWIIGDPEIGSATWIGAFCVIDGSGGLKVGANCHISSGVQIYTHSTVERCISGGLEETKRASTSIGDNCHIGAGAIILMGTTIGNFCVIGAGSLVLQNSTFPDGSLVVGNPAQVKPGYFDRRFNEG